MHRQVCRWLVGSGWQHLSYFIISERVLLGLGRAQGILSLTVVDVTLRISRSEHLCIDPDGTSIIWTVTGTGHNNTR